MTNIAGFEKIANSKGDVGLFITITCPSRQQIGGPPVPLWRALRRIEERVIDDLFRPIWSAADSVDWHTFVQLLGGPAAKRSEIPLSFCRDPQTGVGRYGDPIAERITGVVLAGARYLLPVRNWIIQILTSPIALERAASESVGLSPCTSTIHMKLLLAVGQTYQHEDGLQYEVVRLTKKSITLEAEEGEILHMDFDEFADEIENETLTPVEDETEDDEDHDDEDDE